MAERSEAVRARSFGQNARLSPVDRFGVWLSGRAIRRHVKSFAGLRVGDFGCGYDAWFVRTILGDVREAVLVDVARAPDIAADARVNAIEGHLPDALDAHPSASLDVVLCISALEHLSEPQRAVQSFRRLLRPGGILLVNVPSWRGKRFLELSAFRLHLSPAAEMDDHKRYYDPRDLWTLLVDAGFRPSGIKCYRHKFGLNTFAACRVPRADA